MRRANVLPIAVMAFALVAFLFVLDYSMNSTGKWPWSVNAKKTANIPSPSTDYAYREGSDRGFCSTIEIYHSGSGAILTTLDICEDNVASFHVTSDSIKLTTTCGRIYTYTLLTKQEQVTDTPVGRCSGSLTITQKTTDTQTNTNTASTADWKTYTDPKGVFTAKYPSTFSQLSCNNSFSYPDIRFVSSSDEPSMPCNGKMNGVMVSIRGTSDAQSQYIYDTTALEKEHSSAKESTVMVDGYHFRRITWVAINSDSTTTTWDEVFAQNNDNVYVLTNTGGVSTATFEKFLSSFAFTKTDPKAEWWYYSSDKYPYGIDYRNYWTPLESTVTYGNVTGQRTTFSTFAVEVFPQDGMTTPDAALAHVRNLSATTLAGVSKNAVPYTRFEGRRYSNVPSKSTHETDVVFIDTGNIYVVTTAGLGTSLSEADFTHILDSLGVGGF